MSAISDVQGLGKVAIPRLERAPPPPPPAPKNAERRPEDRMYVTKFPIEVFPNSDHFRIESELVRHAENEVRDHQEDFGPVAYQARNQMLWRNPLYSLRIQWHRLYIWTSPARSSQRVRILFQSDLFVVANEVKSNG